MPLTASTHKETVSCLAEGALFVAATSSVWFLRFLATLQVYAMASGSAGAENANVAQQAASMLGQLLQFVESQAQSRQEAVNWPSLPCVSVAPAPAAAATALLLAFLLASLHCSI